MQRLQNQILTLQASNLFHFSAISWSHWLFLCPSSIAYLFQIYIIIVSNVIGLRSSYRLVWFFFGSFENSGPVILNATRYGIAKLSLALCSGLDLNLILYRIPVWFIWGVSLISFFSSSLLPSLTCWYAFYWGFLVWLIHFFVAAKFLLIVISHVSCYLKYKFIFWLFPCYKMQYTDIITSFFLSFATSFILSFSCLSESPTFK